MNRETREGFLKRILNESRVRMFLLSEKPDRAYIQIQFLLILKSFVLQKGAVERRDLVNAPFAQIHLHGIEGIFKPNEINEILNLTEKFNG